MRDNILRWCRDQHLFDGGGPVLLALSGGADSVAALHVLLSLREPLSITVEAAHLNHRLRGAESDRDEAFCRDLCARLGVPLHTQETDVAACARQMGLGVEEAARHLRYAFLQRTARGARVATAHNADDNLETMLMHLLRGSGLRGLGGIPPRREEIVRPLLCVTRAEIQAYLAEHGLSYVEDSSNDTDDYLRNRIRHHTLPVLRSETPDLARRALETALRLRGDEAYLSQQAALLLDRAQLTGGVFRVGALRDAPTPLRLRALGQLLRQAGAHDLTRAHLDAADGVLFSAQPAARTQVPGACLRREYDRLTAAAPAFLPIAPQPVPLPGALQLPDGRVLLCRVDICPVSTDYPNEFALNPALLDDLTVRSRLPGDRLRTAGGDKTLQKRLIDCKIPAAQRDAVPVLTVGGRVIAAFGVGADPAFRASPGQKAALLRLEQPQNKV